jgi:hypothetical protein
MFGGNFPCCVVNRCLCLCTSSPEEKRSQGCCASVLQHRMLVMAAQCLSGSNRACVLSVLECLRLVIEQDWAMQGRWQGLDLVKMPGVAEGPVTTSTGVPSPIFLFPLLLLTLPIHSPSKVSPSREAKQERKPTLSQAIVVSPTRQKLSSPFNANAPLPFNGPPGSPSWHAPTDARERSPELHRHHLHNVSVCSSLNLHR